MYREELKNEILNRFLISEEMKEYLYEQELPPGTLFDVIAGSLESLQVKFEWLCRLNDSCGGMFVNEQQALKEAIRALRTEDDSIYLVTMKWMDRDIQEEKTGPAYPCENFDKVEACVRRCLAEDFNYPEIEPEEDDGWFQVSKWVKEDGKDYACTYVYYLFGTKAVFFEKNDETERNTGPGRAFCSSTDLNLPVPFLAGDIVSIDCRPVFPEKPALILSVGDNKDSCSPWALAAGGDGKLMTAGVKHALFFTDPLIDPVLVSPLYRLRLYQGEYSEENHILKEIGEDIRKESVCRL